MLLVLIMVFIFGFDLGMLTHETIRRYKAIKKFEHNQYYKGFNDENIDKEEIFQSRKWGI